MKNLFPYSNSIGFHHALQALLCSVAILAADVALAQPFTIDTTSRETVRVLYNTVYDASEDVPINWTGNIATCAPGTVDAAYLTATLLRVNYYRAMAGVPSSITFTDADNTKAQATALLMSANRDINHNPPPGWNCSTQLALDGAASNLNIGSTGPKSIDSFMHDGGDNNSQAGHRRWILLPSQLTMGSGNVPATVEGDYPPTAALWVHNTKAPQRPAVRDDFVAWPPKGFSPYQVVFPRWMLCYPNADFAATTVTMQRNGANVPLQIESRGAGAGEPAIVWIPNGVGNDDNWPRPAADETYTVNVNNVIVNGTPRNFTYTVTVFDPLTPGPDYAPPVLTGPNMPPLNQDTAYNFTAVPNATAYEWRSTKLSPLNLTDGAEAGLANFTAPVGAYNPIVMDFKASGNAGFNLRLPGSDFRPQSLTFNRTLQVNGASQIAFKSRLGLAASLSARVEVSVDDGGTWTAVFTQAGTENGEPAFSDKVVPLAAYAERQIRVRFSLAYAGGPKFSCCDPLGWYVDDITFVNLHEAQAPVIATVAAGTAFTFHPAEQSAFGLNVRPQYFGRYLGDWGPTKLVSTVTTAPTAPLIATQPQGQTVNAGANVTLTVGAQGTAPLSYGWRRNGTPVANGATVQGANTATLTLQNVQAGDAGTYTVGVTNTAGNATSTPAVLVVNDAPTLATALDTTGLNWTSAGNAPWTAQTTITHDGVDAARSGPITHSQQSVMETMVTGPVTVAFWWRVESEQNYDFLSVELDGTMQTRISGTVNWEAKTVAVPAGTHTLRWTYAKDGSESAGADAGWVDEVTVQQTQPPPPLAGALDTTTIAWAAAGNQPWFSQTAITHDGVDAVQSGPIADSQESRLEANILGPASLSFWWKVNSEGNYDHLIFELDGNRPFEAISGNMDWGQKTVQIPAGTHAVKWIYRKDGSVSAGADAGYVDQVVLTNLTPGEAGEPGPLLQYTASGAKLRLTWPEAALGYKLEVTTSFTNPEWTEVPEDDISKEAGEFFIILDTAAGSQFFRLVEVLEAL